MGGWVVFPPGFVQSVPVQQLINWFFETGAWSVARTALWLVMLLFVLCHRMWEAPLSTRKAFGPSRLIVKNITADALRVEADG